MSINLPAVIQHAAQPIRPEYEAKLDIPLPIKKFILVISKDLKPADLDLLKDYRCVEYNDNVHRNIPITAFAFDFLILDLREKGDRYCYMKEVAPNRQRYHVIGYCHGFEEADFDVECDNIISKFPERQARREDFEMLLLIHRIKAPKWYVSLFSCILNFYNRTKN